MSTNSKPVMVLQEPNLVYRPAVKSEVLGRRNTRKAVTSKLQSGPAKQRSNGFKAVEPDALEPGFGQCKESETETVGG